MTINELGSIGEFIGAVGIVVTLIYLAVQTRQTNISNRMVATSTTVAAYNQMNLAMMNSEHTLAVRKAVRGEPLSSEEKAVVRWWMSAYLNLLAQITSLHHAGMMPEDDYVLLMNEAVHVFQSKTIQKILGRNYSALLPNETTSTKSAGNYAESILWLAQHGAFQGKD